MASITAFLTRKLKLKVNEQKSAVARPWERKFLGFSFTVNREPKRRIAPKAVHRFKERVRELTRRNKGVGIEQMAEKLTSYLGGWIGYFGKCQTPSVLEGLEQWIRRRLRSAIWRAVAIIGVHEVCKPPSARRGSGSGSPNGWQCSWPVAGRRLTGTSHCVAQCLLRLARDSKIDCAPIAQLAEPPYADPHVRWCGRGGAARLPPIPIDPLFLRS